MKNIVAKDKVLRVLGTRGIPASHGGFETFAEYLSLYLVEKGWKVIVYCQEDGEGEVFEDIWQGVHRVRIPIKKQGAAGTIIFDWISTRHAAKSSELVLTLGYNTAIFCALLRVKKIPNVINMDGIEWKRQKWGIIAKTWFYLNERAGCWLGNHLVADHPEIKKHLATRVNPNKITTIAYGAEKLSNLESDVLNDYGLLPDGYMTLIARPEPENSILEVIEGFSEKSRGCKLVVLGNYEPEKNSYHKKVIEAASSEVVFLGAIYDKKILNALRFFSLAYIHGHQVGGTNPSLIEAMGASNPVLAHDNKFNRWVLADGGRYFSDADSLSKLVTSVLDNSALRSEMKNAVVLRYESEFTWKKILKKYEDMLVSCLPNTDVKNLR